MTETFSSVPLLTPGLRREIAVLDYRAEPVLVVSTSRDGERFGCFYFWAAEAHVLERALEITDTSKSYAATSAGRIALATGWSIEVTVTRDRSDGRAAIILQKLDVDGERHGRATWLRGDEIAALREAVAYLRSITRAA